jgi:hypothetical protein
MPNTVGDFIRRFGGSQTVDDRDAQAFHDRFVSTREEDRDFDNDAYNEGASEYLGKLPDDEFRQVARRAVSQTPKPERKDMLGSILEGLGGGGSGGIGDIAKILGLGSSDPDSMSDEDAARVIDYTRKQRPDVLRKTVAEKPWFVKALGNPVVTGALAIAAAKLMSNSRSRHRG